MAPDAAVMFMASRREDEITKRCPVCGRFRAYERDDEYCIVCGHEGLEPECACGRPYGYALAEEGDVHCPRCGKVLRGRNPEFE